MFLLTIAFLCSSVLTHFTSAVIYLLLIISIYLGRYPAINKPAAVLHWLNHVDTEAEFIVILDADMILRGPITPWEYGAERGRPVSTPYG